MKTILGLAGLLGLALHCPAQLEITACSRSGAITVSNVFTNGVTALLKADAVEGPWRAAQNLFTTATVAQANPAVTGATRFYRAQALDLSGGRVGFTNLTRAYGLLSTIAGAGGPQDANNWQPESEGGPAVNAVLSAPHIAIADQRGEIYIADKDAHGVRKIRLDGTIVTAAGTSVAGDGPDTETNATQCALNQPNGLWLKRDGTVFILDLGNHKIRRLDTNGMIQTHFTVPISDAIQRGLWVSEDETLAYVTTFTTVKKWERDVGLTDFSTGYLQLGNIAMDPWNNLVVTDRSAHRVYRLDAQGNRTPIAGNGATTGGGDGQLALQTALEEVRGVWFLPTGAYLLCTHRSSRLWYVDTAGYIHLLLNGYRSGTHAGDGTWFYRPTEYRVSECRAVTVDYSGNILLTENDAGYVRKVEFLPW
jgi:DNA-binding beta-propeller fold protein YncE